MGSIEKTANETFDYEIKGQYLNNGIRMLASTPASHLKQIEAMQTTIDDCLVATFSKSGTTWLQEILYLVNNGADAKEAASRPLTQRVPFVDYNKMWPLIEAVNGPKLIKSHLGADFFSDKLRANELKAIVMMRNPKDTLCSYYNFYRSNRAFGNFEGSWDEFFQLIKSKNLIYGDWFDYTLGWWNLRGCKNVMFLKYEDMLKDSESGIRQVAKFCDKKLTDDQITNIVNLTTFKTMKENKSVNYVGADFLDASKPAFMRKGISGDWRNYFTVNQSEYFDKWFQHRMHLSGLDFNFGK